jgi:hypothetical protein
MVARFALHLKKRGAAPSLGEIVPTAFGIVAAVLRRESAAAIVAADLCA